jgi:hypothetical protein
VLALDSPVSIVTPPTGSASSPLQIVSDSSGYYFNNPSQLSVYVGNSPSDGSPITQQALGLSFYGHGLKAGDSVTFSLTFDKAIVDGSSPPQIPQFSVVDTALNPISSIQIKYDGPTGSTGSGSSSNTSGSGSDSTSTGPAGSGPQEVFAPEPLSCLVWAALAGAGAWRVRARSRRGQPRP